MSFCDKNETANDTAPWFILKSNEEIETEEWEVKEKKIWIDSLIRAAEFGDEEAQLTLGNCYIDGDGVEEDTKKGVYWNEKRAESIINKMKTKAEQGDVEAMFALAHGGRGYHEDLSVFAYSKLRLEDTIYWYIKAAEHGHDEAQYHLSMYYSQGWFSQVGHSNHDSRWYSHLYWDVIPIEAQDEDGDFDVDRFKEAVHSDEYDWWTDSDCGLAGGYNNEKRNIEEATIWITKSAERGFIFAESLMGDYYSGSIKASLKSIPKDDAKAFDWYTKAARQGSNYAQRRLGDYYSTLTDDTGVPKDEEKAKFWYEEAEEDFYPVLLSYLDQSASEFDWDKYEEYHNDFGRTFGKPVGDLLLDGDILKKCKSSATEVVIPDNISEIDSFAFNDCIKLRSVTIPNSVKKIGDCAFANCNSLTNVTIPKTVKEISGSAFFGCNNLIVESKDVRCNNRRYGNMT